MPSHVVRAPGFLAVGEAGGAVIASSHWPLVHGINVQAATDSVQTAFLAFRGDTNVAGQLQLLVAILVSLAGASLTVIGMVIQKFAHQEAAKADARNCDAPLLPGCISGRSFFGLAVWGLGNVVTWVALGLGPNSVLACFNSWNIIFAMVVGPTWLGENVSRDAKISAVFLMAGCIWVTCTGPRSYRLETVESINLLFAKLPFTISSIALATILVAMRVRAWLLQHLREWRPSDSLQVTLAAAIFGSYAVIFSKCTSLVVHNSMVENDMEEVAHWQFYLWAGLTLIFGFLQIQFLSESLRSGKATFVIPAYQSCSMALQIVVGGIFFREYAYFGVREHLCFWPGVALVIAGVVALTRSTDFQE